MAAQLRNSTIISDDAVRMVIKMKKVFSLLLASLMVVSALGGCSSSNSSSASGNSASETSTAGESTAQSASTAENSADAGEVQIDFWHSFSSGTNLDCIEKIISDFNAAHEGEY